MKKLTKLIYRNLQRHKLLEVEVDPLVTVLVGQTDAGKSSAIRGAGFCLLNTPSSPKLARRNQPKPAEVTAEFGKTHVKRTRSKKVNTYHLNGKKYVAFKKEPPGDVAKFLNLGPVNFQRQFDAISWFAATPGQVSKRLNAIVDLEVVDNALAEAARLVRESAANVKFSRERLRESKKLAATLDWVPAAVAKYRAVERAEKEHAEIRSRNAAIAKLVRAATSSQKTRDRALNAILAGRKALLAGSRLAKARRRRVTIEKLVNALTRIERVTAHPVPDVSKLAAVRKECDAVAERRRNIEMLVNEALTVRREQCDVEARLAEARRRLKRLRPKTCKACGRPIRNP